MTQNQSLSVLGQIAPSTTGTAGQILTSNGSSNSYWSTVAAGTNVAAQYAWTNTQSFSNSITFNGAILSTNTFSANSSVGTATHVLTSGGAGANVYWAAAAGGGGGGVTITNDTTTASSLYIPFSATTTGTMSAANVSSTKLYFVPSTGTLNATIYNSLSDRTKKTNINTIENALEKITMLRGVSFNWKDNNKPSYGLIAQEVEQVIPEVVDTNEEGTKTLNYDALIGFIVEAIKEMKHG